MPLSAEGSAFVEFVYRMVQEGMTDDDLRQELRNYDIEPYLDRMSKILEARNVDLTKKMIQSHLWADPDVYGHVPITHADKIKRLNEILYPRLTENYHVLFIDPDYMPDLFRKYVMEHVKRDRPEDMYRFIQDNIHMSEAIIYVDDVVDHAVSEDGLTILLINVKTCSETRIGIVLTELLRKEAEEWQVSISAKYLLDALRRDQKENSEDEQQ